VASGELGGFAMRSPDRYFTDPKEKELALLVWEKGREQLMKKEFNQALTKAYIFLHSTPDIRNALSASDWITDRRGDGEDIGNLKVNSELGKKENYFSPENIANVEHVYRAAYLSICVTPAVSLAAAGAYELIVDPLIKDPVLSAVKMETDLGGWEAFKHVASGMAWKLAQSYPHNYRQFVGPDWQGWLMGGDLWSDVFTRQTNRDPAAALQTGLTAFNAMTRKAAQTSSSADELAEWPVTKPGTMLSVVSMDRYESYEYWPLIWDYNYSSIGDNPNLVPVGITLRIRKLERYSDAQKIESKKRSPTWKNYPTYRGP
jgi:hypothetical protein